MKPTNWEKYGKRCRERKRREPWKFKCLCGNPGAKVEGDGVVCAGCEEKERKRYEQARFSYLPMPEEVDC